MQLEKLYSTCCIVTVTKRSVIYSVWDYEVCLLDPHFMSLYVTAQSKIAQSRLSRGENDKSLQGN